MGLRRQAAVILAAAAVLCLFLGPAESFGLDVPKLSGRVNDYGNMISPQARATLEAELAALERADSTQVVVLTMPSLEGDVIEEFSIRVGDAWKIGQKGKDNGVIFIVSKADRKLRIEVGRGLQGVLTDLQTGRIIDTVIKPRFKQNRFDDGFLEGTRDIIAASRGEFKPTPKATPYISPNRYFEVFLVAVFLVLPFLRRINRFLPIPAGAAGGPLLHVLSTGGAASGSTLGILAVVGGVVGLFVAGIGSSKKHGHHGSGGGFLDSFGGSSWSSGGGSDFGGGGGGSFDGGGSSGDW
ncbi:MAG: TPM domain-containing protein [Nitrospirota bacterium]